MKRYLCCLVIAALVAFGGCRRRARPVTEREARRYDLPVLLGESPITCSQDGAFSAHTSKKSKDDVAAWYTREMERFGWRLLAHTDSDNEQVRASQSLYVFEKPASVCVITLRQAGSRTVIYTHVMPRRFVAR